MAFMIVTEETVNFVGCGDGGRMSRRERCSWSKMGTGVADGGRNQGGRKQGQGNALRFGPGVSFVSASRLPVSASLLSRPPPSARQPVRAQSVHPTDGTH